MDEDIDRMVIQVRADARGLEADVAEMRAAIEGPLKDGAERAGAAIESALLRAVRTGKFGFEDLKRVAAAAMADIARSALQQVLPGGGGNRGGGAGGGLIGLATSLLGGFLGLPGRATGGPVAPGRAYRVGERGPEVFVPTSSGRIETGGGLGGAAGVRDVRITVNVGGTGAGDPQRMAASGRQIARAVRRAVTEER